MAFKVKFGLRGQRSLEERVKDLIINSKEKKNDVHICKHVKELKDFILAPEVKFDLGGQRSI